MLGIQDVFYLGVLRNFRDKSRTYNFSYFWVWVPARTIGGGKENKSLYACGVLPPPLRGDLFFAGGWSKRLDIYPYELVRHTIRVQILYISSLFFRVYGKTPRVRVPQVAT